MLSFSMSIFTTLGNVETICEYGHGAIHKGCPHIRGEGSQAKVDKCGQGEGGG